MLAGGAGIFNSRIGSFLGSELWRAGWLGGLFIVVGPGGRISTAVDCSRVLNVNRSLYSSTSRVERSEMFCERSEHACTRPRLVLLERLLFTFIVSMVVLPEDSTDHYFQFCRIRVCLRAFSGN